MPRRAIIAKRATPQDPVYSSQMVQRFVHRMMERGKKSTAQTLLYEALEIIKERTKTEPIEILTARSRMSRRLSKLRRVGLAVRPTRFQWK